MPENLVILALIGGAVVIAALIAVLWIRRIRRQHVTVVPSEQYEPQRPRYACPRCGRPMQPGYAVFADGLHFLPDLRRAWRHPLDIEGGLPNTVNFTLGAAGNAAWRCADCQMVLVDHSCLVSRRRHLKAAARSENG